MSEVTVKPQASAEASVTPQDETFTFILPDGSAIVCGKPRGVLKLRIRDILPKELMDDAEIVGIATAFLSIRSVDGAPLWLKNYNNFEAFVNRFAGDEQIDAFMEAYNRLVNPKLIEAVEQAMKDAEERNIKPTELKDFVATRIAELSREQQERVKD